MARSVLGSPAGDRKISSPGRTAEVARGSDGLASWVITAGVPRLLPEVQEGTFSNSGHQATWGLQNHSNPSWKNIEQPLSCTISLGKAPENVSLDAFLLFLRKSMWQKWFQLLPWSSAFSQFSLSLSSFLKAICFGVCWAFVAAQATLRCGAQACHCGGSSYCGTQALGSTGFSRLQHIGWVVAAPRL